MTSKFEVEACQRISALIVNLLRCREDFKYVREGRHDTACYFATIVFSINVPRLTNEVGSLWRQIDKDGTHSIHSHSYIHYSRNHVTISEESKVYYV